MTSSRWKLFLFVGVLLLSVRLASAAEDPLRRQGYLGINLRAPSAGSANAEVTRVREGTLAESSGIKVGDRVLRINGRLMDDPVVFAQTWGGLRAGDSVDLEILRDGQVIRHRFDSLPALPMETFDNLDVTYGSALTDKGHRVRTIFTRPKGAQSKVPGILLVSWLTCSAPEWPLGSTGGTMKLIHGVATRSGFAMMRVEKPGAGDSEGGPPCLEADFESELAAYKAALKALKQHPGVDPDRIFLLGSSNGAAVAPLVAEGEKVRGLVVSGAWVKTWYEHMMEHERRRLALLGSTQAEINDRLKGYAELYTLYYIRKMTPGEAVRQHPHLAGLWYDGPAHQYGRPAVFYHQLQDLNLAAAWEKVDAPVLIVYGTNDWIMTQEDHQIIADIVNRKSPGRARLVAVPNMDHSYLLYDSLQAAFDEKEPGKEPKDLVPMIVDWLKSQS